MKDKKKGHTNNPSTMPAHNEKKYAKKLCKQQKKEKLIANKKRCRAGIQGGGMSSDNDCFSDQESLDVPTQKKGKKESWKNNRVIESDSDSDDNLFLNDLAGREQNKSQNH